MRQITLSALLFSLVPAFAMADDLDRYRDATITKTEQMQAFYISRVPEMEEALSAMDWDDETEVVAACTLDAMREERGDDGVEEYLTALEDWAEIPVTSFAGMGDGMPAILSDSFAMELATECGAMDMAMAKMQESGMMALIQDPSVMERLMAGE
jgi:ADP-ribosylglycohydrolase